MKSGIQRSVAVAWPIDNRIRSMTVMFTDMAESSRFAEMFGARAALYKRKRHNRLLVPLIESHRGTLVEAFGDSLLSVFESADDAGKCAIAMQRKLVKYNRSIRAPHRELEIHIRAGLHTGRLILARYPDHCEVVGRAVNTAARVEAADEKKTDQILLSESARQQIAAESGFSFEPAGAIDAKGIGELQLYRLLWRRTATMGTAKQRTKV